MPKSKRESVMFDLMQEVDGRWIAEYIWVPGALAYGQTRWEAIRNLAEILLNLDSPP